MVRVSESPSQRDAETSARAGRAPRILRAFLLVCVLPACAGDWRDELTSPLPGKFPPPAAFKATYKFGWSALSAATADFDFSKTTRGDLRLVVDAKTVGAVRALWRMDARHEALCRAVTLRPISLMQTELYKSKSKFTRADFDAEGVSCLRESRPADKTPPKIKRFECPDVFDLHTALLFVRSQCLEPGERYCFVVYPGSAAYLSDVDVVGREKLKVAGRSYDCVKLEIHLREIKKDLTLAPHRKFRRASAWVSDDRDRLLLRVQAEIFVGSVWAEMQRVRNLKPET